MNLSTPVHAAVAPLPVASPAGVPGADLPPPLRLAQAGKGSREEDAPAPGELLLPPSNQPEKKDEEKQCMTVCARWGNDCTLINQGAGGLQRRCRRTCKQFAEECF